MGSEDVKVTAMLSQNRYVSWKDKGFVVRIPTSLRNFQNRTSRQSKIPTSTGFPLLLIGVPIDADAKRCDQIQL